MRWKFWEKQTVRTAFGDMELKVLSRYVINQQQIINKLSEQNQQLTAELQVLKESVETESNINRNRFKRIKTTKRNSPFKK